MEDQAFSFTFSWLLLLPVFAGVLILQGTWLDNDKIPNRRPKKYQRRLRARILIHRTLIVSLLLATFIVYISSLTILPTIVQGLLLTVLLMLPVFAYLLITVFKWPANKRTPLPQSLAHSYDLKQGESQAATQTHVAVTEEMESSELDNTFSRIGQETIPATSYSELADRVASLQNDKINLQKLVIAQRSVINFEQQRFQKAQALTKNAILIMRRTKAGAEVAIRVAKSERNERLRLEADNAKGQRQFKNTRPGRHIKETANY